jgi:hypothetical protein
VAKNAISEVEHHIVSLKFRVTGAGNLKIKLTDLDQIQTENLVDLPMALTTRIEPTRLANFQSQRTRWEIRTTEIDEVFAIRKIIMFVKPVAVEYPG